MYRRDLSKVLFASAAGAALVPAVSRAQTCSPCYPPGDLRNYLTSTSTTQDITTALTAALSANSSVYIPDGAWSLSSAITLKDGQTVTGQSINGTVITSPAGTQTFSWHPPGFSDRIGPSVRNMTIHSDFPITINSLTTTLVGNGGDSPCLQSYFQYLVLRPVTALTGIGISAAKLFDSEISHCDIRSYDSCIVLHGCDLNSVRENRLAFFGTWGILEQSAQTFGSQNEITHNDVLSGSTSSTYIKSTSHHVTIYDNYLEAPSAAVSGFVDVTSAGAPVYGNNAITLPYSIVIRDNRLDGESNATNFVYRIDPTNAVTIVCDNRSTTGLPGTSLFSVGVTAIQNPSHKRALRIRGETWGVWHGYDSNGVYDAAAGTIICSGRHIPALLNKDQNTSVQLLADKIILPASFVGLAWVVPNALSVSNDVFANGVTYTCKVIVRSTAASGDTLNIAGGSNSHGDILNPFALTDQFKTFSFTMAGRPRAGFDYYGVYMTRTGSAGDIQIAQVSWSA